MKVAKELSFPLLPDSILVMDRWYVDFEWLWGLGLSGVFFVTRMKDNLGYVITGQQKTLKGKGILADETIELTGIQTQEKYPDPLRLVTWATGINQFPLAAELPPYPGGLNPLSSPTPPVLQPAESVAAGVLQ